ncbi:hypothetical protein MANES_07G032500v8 [Manihot esculenta]|uniref:Peptidase C14 caspase domain-containing protein n=1 Tax=Manihot esculenta TaxID=3983 RepID=A0A2C9VJF1_MANES|nr:hypothetical protein MANES_07G032500v8 [Manihot esculenta]
MDPSQFLQDTRTHICSRCRQRLFAKTTNVPEIRCPACQSLASITNTKADGRFSSIVSQVVQNFKNTFSRRFYRQDTDTKQHNSLNCNPSPLKLSSSRTSRSDQRPRKRELLIGVTYKNDDDKLTGTVNDVKNMRSLLIDYFSFHPQNILVLTEEETDPTLIPTKKNIEISLKWLVKDCRAGDSLVFYFSGHGSQEPDLNLDEHDGFDESICPVDYTTEGMITDNYINTTIVWPLPKGVTLHAIVDACHSGTILDLVHVYDRQCFHEERNKWCSDLYFSRNCEEMSRSDIR